MDDPDPNTIMVYGRIPVPRDQLVDFLEKPHHLVYLRRDRDTSMPFGALRVGETFVRPGVVAQMNAVAEEMAPTDAAPPPTEDPTTVAPSSLAESTPIAESAPVVPSPPVEPVPVAEPVPAAPSSLTEPPSSTVLAPTQVTTSAPHAGPARAHEGGHSWPTLEEAYLGSTVRDDAVTISSTSAAAGPESPHETAAAFPSTSTAAGPSPDDAADTARTHGEDGASSSIFATVLADTEEAIAVLREMKQVVAAFTSCPGPATGTTSSSTLEAHDEDWIIVETGELPTLPTTDEGGLLFTRLDLAHVELVPVSAWTDLMCPWTYDDDPDTCEANKMARRSLLIRYWERQLQADRILSKSNPSFKYMLLLCGATDHFVAFPMSVQERQLARDQGFTRIWVAENEWDRGLRYYVRDKDRFE